MVGSFDPFVMHNAQTWSEGIKAYKAEKSRHFYGGEVERPVRVTHYFKKREERAVNPILQTYADPEMESRTRTLEQNHLSRMLNEAYDKQTYLEQKFDIITQKPKKGHIFEVEFTPKLKPPSLVTANNTDYDIISTRKFEEHHWAPPGKRPARIPTPQRKPQELTAVNKPREFNILSNTYKEFHAERTKFDADQTRRSILDKFHTGRDFDCVKVQYFDEDKEREFQENRAREIKARGKNQFKKFPPTYQKSEATVVDIVSGVAKDEERLAAIQQRERNQWQAKASTHVERQEAAEEFQKTVADAEMARKLNRVAYERWEEAAKRGYNILSNDDFSTHGAPPAPHTRPAPTLQKHFLNGNADAKASFSSPRSPGLSPASKARKNEAGEEAPLRRQNTRRGALDTSTAHDTGVRVVESPLRQVASPLRQAAASTASEHHSQRAGGGMTVYDFRSTNRPPINPPAGPSGLGGSSPHPHRDKFAVSGPRTAGAANELGRTSIPAPPQDPSARRSPEEGRHNTGGGGRGGMGAGSSLANSRVRTGGFNRTPRV